MNQAPTDIALSNTRVAEHAVGAVIGRLTVTDPDVGDHPRLSVSDSRFEVVGGQLRVAAVGGLHFNGSRSIRVDVTAIDDGGLSRTETFAITNSAMRGPAEPPEDATAGSIHRFRSASISPFELLGLSAPSERLQSGSVASVALTTDGRVDREVPAAPRVEPPIFATVAPVVIVSIPASNDPPVATDDANSVNTNGTLNGTSVLANDSDLHGGAPAENNTPLTAALVSGVANGVLVLNPDGTYSYTPGIGFDGTDSFTYRAVDSLGAPSDPATVTITVVPPGMTLAGDPNPNILIGGNGNDTITGEPGNDILVGNGGDDNLDGGSGDDTLDGGTGNDFLDGGTGNDFMEAGLGDDFMDGGTGDDIMDSGPGTNTMIGGSGDDAMTAGDGNDSMDGGTGADLMNGGAGNDSMFGDTGIDVMNGGDGDDTLSGGTEADSLNGDAGNDTLQWDDGLDALNGGTGTDTLLLFAGDLDLGIAGVVSIERIDLGTANGPDILTLTDADVLATSGTGTLTIVGGSGDVLEAGTGWSSGGQAGGFQTYTKGGATMVVDLLITPNSDILL